MPTEILVDIDMTIVDPSGKWIDFLLDRYGEDNFDREAFVRDSCNRQLDYCLAKYVDEKCFLNKRDYLAFWRQEDLYDDLDLLPNAKSVIDDLHSKGNSIIFVSHAKAGHLKSKWDLLRRNFSWVEDSETSGFVATKRKDLIKGSVIIDDRHAFLNQGERDLRLKMNTPYTQCEDILVSCVAVNNWKEIGEILL